MAVALSAACLALAGCAHQEAAGSTSVPPPATTMPSTATTPTFPTTVPTEAAPTTVPTASDACDEGTVPGTGTWSEHSVIAGTCPQVLDLAADAGFALVSPAPSDQGPWVLQRIDIDRATTESGPTFSTGTLAVAGGYLWISCGRTVAGESAGPLLCQVDPATLDVVRQVQLPPPDEPGWGADVLVAAAAADTVWVGYGHTLVHVDAGDGTVLSSVPVTSGTVASVAVDPGQQVLYVALSYPTVSGQTVDAAVLEFDARTGRLLAATSAHSAVTDSVAGGILTAVPGGVWVSFRTGMLGETIFLRQSDLAFVAPPSSAREAAQPDGVFAWIMSASTIYGNGALLIVNENGVLACADPLSGVIRVQEHLAAAQGGDVAFLAVEAASGQVLITDGNGLQSITPPAACWG